MKWIEFDNFGPTPVPEFDTQSDTINPDAASAQGALTVAAVSQARSTASAISTAPRRSPCRAWDTASWPMSVAPTSG